MRESKAYAQFLHDTQEWLSGYADYSVRRDKRIGSVAYGHDFYRYVQFVLDMQMREAHSYAQSRSVMLKGDIPIGVNRHGCDVEMDPRYFNMNGQAGAPPDNFAADGQNWGFPTYNWDAMLEDGCRWWIRRFQNMARYFDAYRIDHVLGFFRIWEIPIHSVTGLLGQFQPSRALTLDEIHGYGLWLDEDFMTQPFVADWVLERFFPQQAGLVKERFLTHAYDDIWRMKPEFDTQRKVEEWMKSPEADRLPLDGEQRVALKKGLFRLISNVLFVRDHKNPDLFHPRIAVQLDPAYETLWQHDKENFNRLYNDYVYHRNNQFWYEEAMKKLPVLVEATDMLVCAEDLGMVPDCVSWVMNQLQILSLELVSMPKDNTVRWGVLERNPWRSVCTISSHDSATMRMWWDEDWQETQAFYNEYLGHGGPAPHPMPGWLAEDMVARHLRCPSALCILTLQDWLACSETLRREDAGAERINIPANPRHYWRYRMHLNLEDLLAADEFNDKVCDMIKNSGR